MNVAELTDKLTTASGLLGQERTSAYTEVWNEAVRLFPQLEPVVAGNLMEMEYGRFYVHPTDSSGAETFQQVFDVVPGLRSAYDLVVVHPLFADRTDGWFDIDPVSKKTYWVNRDDTCKGAL